MSTLLLIGTFGLVAAMLGERQDDIVAALRGDTVPRMAVPARRRSHVRWSIAEVRAVTTSESRHAA